MKLDFRRHSLTIKSQLS